MLMLLFLGWSMFLLLLLMRFLKFVCDKYLMLFVA